MAGETEEVGIMFEKHSIAERDGLDLRAFVLAGGDGTRLQSLTHKIDGDGRPKQFSKIFGGKSLLTHTRDRLRPIFSDHQVAFVVIRSHERFYTNELADVDASRIVAQPSNRGTGVAIIAALLQLLKSEPGAIVGFFPSDHYFADDAAFATTVRSAIEVSREHANSIVLLGAKPQWPEVEYGWIEPGRRLSRYGSDRLFKTCIEPESPSVVSDSRRSFGMGRFRQSCSRDRNLDPQSNRTHVAAQDARRSASA